MLQSPSHILELTRALFRQEAEDLLTDLDSALLQLEAAASDPQCLHRAFRAIHTLKGSGATAGFCDVASVLHEVEDILNHARDGRIAMTSVVIDLVLKVADVVRQMTFGPSENSPALLAVGKGIVAQLKSEIDYRPESAVSGVEAPGSEKTEEETPVSGFWSIRFAPNPRIFQTGNDPVLLMRELLLLGPGVVRARTDRLLAEPDFDPEVCYLSWEIQIATTAAAAAIRDVFAFVERESDLQIESIAPDRAWVLPAMAYFEESVVQDFRDEARERVAEVEAQVLALEERPGDPNCLDAIRRALHNLKGLCGLLLSDPRRPPPARYSIRALSEVCHAAESFMEALNGGAGEQHQERIPEILLQTADWLGILLRAFDEPTEQWPTALLQQLDAHRAPLPCEARSLQSCESRSDDSESSGSQSRESRSGESQSSESQPSESQSRESQSSESQSSESQSSESQSSESQSSESQSSESQSSESRSVPANVRQAATPCVILAATEGQDSSGVPHPSLRSRGRTVSLRAGRAAVGPPSLYEGAPVGAGVHVRKRNEVVGDASSREGGPADAGAPRSIRVDQAKLDRLMRAVDELLVTRNSLPVLCERVWSADRSSLGKGIKELGDRIAHITDELQDTTRQIRMMPIRTVFQRFPRMIRDLARHENKQVQLIISGEDTELDKTVLEQLSNPLVHLVRNAVDHGIELPSERLARGKSEMGTVGLEVIKEGSSIVLHVSDDGRGMNPERLRRKAVEKGVLSEADAAGLPEDRVLELIFLPGFSTAEQITDISGRGVGMDAVQSAIRQLHGTITLTSEVGRGSMVSIRLPCSLMVSKGILVECAGDQYVLPVEGIRQMEMIRVARIRHFQDLSLASIRGAIYPVFRLAGLLGLERECCEQAVGDCEANVAIVSTRSGEAAVVVDRFIAQVDVVVKPLAEGLDALTLFQGATILGDGRVALILDTGQLEALVGSALSRSRQSGHACGEPPASHERGDVGPRCA